MLALSIPIPKAMVATIYAAKCQYDQFKVFVGQVLRTMIFSEAMNLS